ncbi:MBL fold metallo-hydrolase [Rhodocytophaga rosea]|uniref:MBL fold metallo-hydrolase n=1 Tax=Rhodocytophaga rosea TaxID=2704465 RepID=A0A6C0GHI2_9BACT|nr:MBL fold metallo-hydrolase [Rhodocytophaga rosea]QHT67160.1 MBL fold metallo-hydrolase [Rhodocytophaga rosea]
MLQSKELTKYVYQDYHVAPGVTGLKIVFVNVYLASEPGSNSWVLIDAGLKGSAGRIKKAAEAQFGAGSRPEAILLTHGHFDHVGALIELAEEWDVPVYAHPLEMPYLTGLSSYPPPDPTVGGGAMAFLSWMYPKGPIDISSRIHPYPEDGSVPGLPGWRLIHTPGHTAGHVSFFRESDRMLIAGDAFVTRKSESALALITDKQEVHGPPAYFTSDWRAAQWTVEKLASLQPAVAATGHGVPMQGRLLQLELETLARNFGRLAVPSQGRYVPVPAETDENGIVSLPAPVVGRLPKMLLGVGLAALAGAALITYLQLQHQSFNKQAYR